MEGKRARIMWHDATHQIWRKKNASNNTITPVMHGGKNIMLCDCFSAKGIRLSRERNNVAMY